jgi:peptide/nickel transport system substrate-binding protein
MEQFASWEVSSKDNKYQGRNITRWRNEEYDKLFRAAESELDAVKRAAMFIRMNDLVIQNVVVIPVLWRNKVHAVSSRLRGLEISGWDSDLATLFNWFRA